MDQNTLNFKNRNSLYTWEKQDKIGSGTYGDVYRGLNTNNNEYVAIKKIRSSFTDDGIPADTLREIVILKSLDHANIIKIYDVIFDFKKTYLILEYMNTDLKNFIDSFPINEQIPIRLIKHILKQTLEGLFYLSMEGILHRDLKPQNILLNFETGSENINVKIADFGLARTYCILTKIFSKNIMTPLYRAPEIFLNVNEYTSAIDIWSLGCIFVELVNKNPLFNGKNEMDVIIQILQLLGKPSYLSHSSIAIVNDKYERKTFSWQDICPRLDTSGIDLISKMLALEPENRITASEALKHEFFKN